MLQIEKNVPFKKTEGKRIYPFRKMEVGDSFFAKVESNDPEEKYKKYLSILGACRYARMGPKKFSAKVEEGGVRCWRVE